MRGHDAVHAPVDELAPVLRVVRIQVPEPGVHGVALTVGSGDVLGRRDVVDRAAELESDRDLEGNRSLRRSGPVEYPSGYTGNSGRVGDAGHELVETVRRGLLE